MATSSGTAKWVIGIAASILLAGAGWCTSAVLASRVSMLMRIDVDVQGLQVYAVSNDKRITRLETQYETIISGIGEMKQILRDQAKTK